MFELHSFSALTSNIMKAIQSQIDQINNHKKIVISIEY